MRLLMNVTHHTARIEEVIGPIELGFTKRAPELVIDCNTTGQTIVNCDVKLACFVVVFDFLFKELWVFALSTCHIFTSEVLLRFVLKRFHEAFSLRV